MKVKRIVIEGPRGTAEVTCDRPKAMRQIRIELHAGRTHNVWRVLANDNARQWRIADGLHQSLEGFRGTNTDIAEYARILEFFAE